MYTVGVKLFMDQSAGTTTVTGVTSDATYTYYNVTFDSFNKGTKPNYISTNVWTIPVAELKGVTDGPITSSFQAITSTSATRVVDVGKTLTLNSGTNVLSSSATLGVNTVQNVAGTQSFSVDSVFQLNAGFTTDRRQAVLNANAPTGANPFATMTDIIAGGGSYAPGGTATGAIQTRSAIGTFTANRK